MLLLTLCILFILGSPISGICARLGLPVSVAYILIGVVLGPIFSTFDNGSANSLSTLAVLAQLGVVMLLFRVGLHSHTQALLEKLPTASLIWVVNVGASLAVGFATAYFWLQWSMATSLVIATAFSATSIAVSAAVWESAGQLNSGTASILLDVAELDDLSAAVLLAVLAAALPALILGNGDIWVLAGISLLEVLAKLVLFVLACYGFAHFLEAKFTQAMGNFNDSEASITIAILGAGLGIALIAETLGFSIAVGALFAGLAFSRDPAAIRNEAGFGYFYELLTPFFFIHIGMQVELSTLQDAAGIGLILFALATAAKVIFTVAPALLVMTWKPAMLLGVSMVPRAEIALVVVYECRTIDSALVPDEVFAGVVILSLASCTLAPILLKRMLESMPRSA